MRREGDEVHAHMDEARAGSTENVVRWVLLFGLGGAILLLSIVWITGALSTSDVEDAATASGRIEAQTDSNDAAVIVSDDAADIEGAPEDEEVPPPGRIAN